jgi:hypothetical protein
MTDITKQVCDLLDLPNAEALADLLWPYLPHDLGLDNESASSAVITEIADALIEAFEEAKPPPYRGDIDLDNFIGARGGTEEVDALDD